MVNLLVLAPLLIVPAGFTSFGLMLHYQQTWPFSVWLLCVVLICAVLALVFTGVFINLNMYVWVCVGV